MILLDCVFVSLFYNNICFGRFLCNVRGIRAIEKDILNSICILDLSSFVNGFHML